MPNVNASLSCRSRLHIAEQTANTVNHRRQPTRLSASDTVAKSYCHNAAQGASDNARRLAGRPWGQMLQSVPCKYDHSLSGMRLRTVKSINNYFKMICVLKKKKATSSENGRRTLQVCNHPTLPFIIE
jgi:hypothetical protein